MPMPNPPVTNGPDMSIFAYLCNNPSVMKTSFRIYNVLRPLGWLYGLVSYIRNRIYDKGIIKSTAFPVPVIGIGNITVGGTGKTPHTEYLVTLVKDTFRTAVLSRGYGRCTHGYILARPLSDSREIGDEPRQILTSFPDIDVAVSEDRAEGISNLIRARAPQAIVLDDAFQHRKVTPSLNILLVNYNRNILSDAILPAGRLRESAAGRVRAHIIVVTKCPPDLTSDNMDSLASKLKVNARQQVFFTAMQYGNIYSMDGSADAPSQDTAVLTVSGIANPAPMEAEIRARFSAVESMSYPDHHNFSAHDIRNIQKRLDRMPADSVIVTTAKDAARLSSMSLAQDLRSRIFVLPVKPVFLRDSDLFDTTLINHIESYKKQ